MDIRIFPEMIRKISLRTVIAVLLTLCVQNMDAREVGGEDHTEASDTVSQDSLKGNVLDEVVVDGVRTWVEDGKIICVPSSQEKNLARDPVSLVKNLHMPMLRDNGTSVTTIGGESLVYYINGVPADEIDMSAFWAKDVKKVEFIEHPKDPRMAGRRNVINIIVSEYEWGGVTQAEGILTIPNYQNIRIASKTAYKRMTYGALLGYNRNRDHRMYTSGQESYRNVFYKGSFHDVITRSHSGNSSELSDGFSAAVNARYNSEKFRATHTLAFIWNHNPGSRMQSEESWSPDLFNSTSASSVTKSKTLSPQLSGNYYFVLGKKWSLNANWSYSYSRNNNDYRYVSGDSESISNLSKEDMHGLSASVMPVFRLSERIQLDMNISTDFNAYSTLYEGSANTNTKMRRNETEAALNITWDAVPDKFSFSLSPGMGLSYRSINGEKTIFNVRPTARLGFVWQPGRKIVMSGNLYYFNTAGEPSQMSDVMVQLSPLLWRTGDDALKNSTTWQAGVSAWYNIAKWFSLSGYLGYIHGSNEIFSTYIPASASRGGLIKFDGNSSPLNKYTALLNLRSTFFNNALGVTLQPGVSHEYYSGGTFRKCTAFSGGARADYTFKNCRLEIEYEAPDRFLDNGGMESKKRSDRWNCRFTYGNGNFYMMASVYDIFNKYHKRINKYSSDYYTAVDNLRETGRRFILSLTYTFGYGKELDHSIDINEGYARASSVVGK